MSKIGLFGGTFNPIHNGHINLALRVQKEFCLDKILFIPAGNPPHKDNQTTEDKIHRFNMVKLATADYPSFLVSDYEIKKDSQSYSYLTISHFKKMFPQDEFFFIVGADSFCNLPEWKKPDLLLKLCTFIVVSRPGISKHTYYEKYDKDLIPDVLFIDDAEFNFSSTEIRSRLKENLPIDDFVSHPVEEYIKTNKLYL